MRLRTKTVVVAIRMPESERDRLTKEAKEAGFDGLSTYLRTLCGVRRQEDKAVGSLVQRVESLEQRLAALEE